jgi:hypothetical protein
MARNTMNRLRLPAVLTLGAAIVSLPLAACDRTERHEKQTTVRKSETPEGTKKTTETTEKKVETNPT